ncbi:hypothetical protein, partial [Hallella sp.]|uniref:hypothetical protein n=1 Tax=Hallella sp. TaxID=2980186 RepID=UPI002A91AF45
SSKSRFYPLFHAIIGDASLHHKHCPACHWNHPSLSTSCPSSHTSQRRSLRMTTPRLTPANATAYE